jgi:hypothetical protein
VRNGPDELLQPFVLPFEFPLVGQTVTDVPCDPGDADQFSCLVFYRRPPELGRNLLAVRGRNRRLDRHGFGLLNRFERTDDPVAVPLDEEIQRVHLGDFLVGVPRHVVDSLIPVDQVVVAVENEKRVLDGVQCPLQNDFLVSNVDHGFPGFPTARVPAAIRYALRVTSPVGPHTPVRLCVLVGRDGLDDCVRQVAVLLSARSLLEVRRH